MNGLAVTAGARIPHGQESDPYFADIILFVGMGDWADHSPLNLGTAVPTGISLDSVNLLGNLATIAAPGGSPGTERAEWPSSLSLIGAPCIFELWFKGILPGDGNSHPLLSGKNSGHVGPFFFVSGAATPSCQWVFGKHDGTTVVTMPPQAFTAGVWTYAALLVDGLHSVAHIGVQGGMTTPGVAQTGDAAGLCIAPHWAVCGDTSDSNVPNNTFIGNSAAYRVTQNTTRGRVVVDGLGVGVPFAVPAVPFPLR